METFPFWWVILLNESADADVFTEAWVSLQLLLALRNARLGTRVDGASVVLSLPEREFSFCFISSLS